MSNKWMKQLNKMEGAVDREYDPYEPGNYIMSSSPSVNWIFSKSPGLPFMEFMLLFGPPKSGKSILTNDFIANLHQMDPEAIAIKFDTEMREVGKVEDFWGIDQDRLTVYNVNEPEFIFDRLKNDILPMVEDGMPLKLVIIDSLTGVQGVKESNRDSITNHLMGDHAKTIQDGLKAIMPMLRRNKIALISTAHIRGNFDAGTYGPKTKMAGGHAQKHTYEYFVKVTRDGSSEGKKTASGEALESDIKDFKGKKEITGHKIYVQMTESTRGVAGRTGQITFDYLKGIVNVEDEIFEMTKNLNLVERPNNRTYILDGVKYSSKTEFIVAIRENEELRNKLLESIYARSKA